MRRLRDNLCAASARRMMPSDFGGAGSESLTGPFLKCPKILIRSEGVSVGSARRVLLMMAIVVSNIRFTFFNGVCSTPFLSVFLSQADNEGGQSDLVGARVL